MNLFNIIKSWLLKGINDLVKSFKPPKLQRAPFNNDPNFMLWAFGHTSEFKCEMEYMIAWNRLHSDIFILLPDGDILTDMNRMYEEYKKFLYKQSKPKG